jgi:large subunit ribosomal protein L25
METPVVEAKPRDLTGSRGCRRLRTEGFVPAVVYGLAENPQPVTVPIAKVEELIRLGAHLVEISLEDGGRQSALLKEIQYDHLGDEILHVDFTRIKRGEKVTLTIPIEFEGIARGVNEGGVVEHLRSELEVTCLPRHIPERIVVDVTGLGLGEHLAVGDLPLPEGVQATTDAELVVATVTYKEEEPEEVEEEEAAVSEPELIRRKAAEEEAEEGGRKPGSREEGGE